MHFNRGILRSLEPKKVDPQMLHRNSPRLGEMLGEDDWFDKMAGIGRDQVRFAHMYKLHAFTNAQKAAILASDADPNSRMKKSNGAPNGNGRAKTVAAPAPSGSADAKALMDYMTERFARLERSLEKLTN
jgi:hypothetical protein